MYMEIIKSVLRHAVPWATALLAGMNIEVGEGTSPVLIVGGAVLVYAGAQVWSIIRKIRNKPRAT